MCSPVHMFAVIYRQQSLVPSHIELLRVVFKKFYQNRKIETTALFQYILISCGYSSGTTIFFTSGVFGQIVGKNELLYIMFKLEKTFAC